VAEREPIFGKFEKVLWCHEQNQPMKNNEPDGKLSKQEFRNRGAKRVKIKLSYLGN
jgi:hypothetical protein